MLNDRIALAACVLAVTAGLAAAQAPKPQPAQAMQPRSGESYLWHGELVSIDAKGMLTVKARVLSDAATEVARFNPGDRVLLTWSGLDIHAGAVRRVTKYEPGQQILDFFALPAELVSRDVQNEHLTFRVQVPQASVGAAKGLKPGEWVSVTTRHRPKGDGDAILAVGGYVKAQT
jgi:hypothetical protein